MIEEHYFKAETINRPWGWIYIGASTPQLEPEVLLARKKLEKINHPQLERVVDLTV
jgi:hypothetical protein